MGNYKLVLHQIKTSPYFNLTDIGRILSLIWICINFWGMDARIRIQSRAKTPRIRNTDSYTPTVISLNHTGTVEQTNTPRSKMKL
jgi:hypothetical protein